LSEWQDSNAQRVIEQTRKVVQSAVGEGAEPEVHTEVKYSPVVPALAEASKDAEMIVVGSRGMGGFRRALLGSVSSGMVHHAHCPVAVIRQEGAEARDTLPVVVGVDGSPASEAATAWAFDEASRRGVDLVALHAWSDLGATPTIGMDWEQFEEDGKEVLAERLAGWREKYPDVSVERRIVYNRPVHWLVEESEKAQLVVVGSHGRGGFTGMLLGSVSAAVVHEAKSPVVVVRPR
jgi:nucleotide-binding universal stress UspA family protein